MWFFGTLFLLLSCSSGVLNVQKKPATSGPVIVVLPFENYTETPLAGLRVSSIAEGVVSSMGYNLKKDLVYIEDKEYTQKEIQEFMKKLADKGARYVVTGSVNEFRYKAGIDGEPVASITLRIYDLKTGDLIYTATGSMSGWHYQSVSILTQKILASLLKQVNAFSN